MKILYFLLSIKIIQFKNKISEIKNLFIEYNMKHAKLYEFIINYIKFLIIGGSIIFVKNIIFKSQKLNVNSNINQKVDKSEIILEDKISNDNIKIENSTQSQPSVIEKSNSNSNINSRSFIFNNNNLKHTDDNKRQAKEDRTASSLKVIESIEKKYVNNNQKEAFNKVKKYADNEVKYQNLQNDFKKSIQQHIINSKKYQLSLEKNIYYFLLSQNGNYNTYSHKCKLNTFLCNLIIGYLKCEYWNLDLSNYIKTIYEFASFTEYFKTIIKVLDFSNLYNQKFTTSWGEINEKSILFKITQFKNLDKMNNLLKKHYQNITYEKIQYNKEFFNQQLIKIGDNLIEINKLIFNNDRYFPSKTFFSYIFDYYMTFNPDSKLNIIFQNLDTFYINLDTFYYKDTDPYDWLMYKTPGHIEAIIVTYDEDFLKFAVKGVEKWQKDYWENIIKITNIINYIDTNNEVQNYIPY